MVIIIALLSAHFLSDHNATKAVPIATKKRILCETSFTLSIISFSDTFRVAPLLRAFLSFACLFGESEKSKQTERETFSIGWHSRELPGVAEDGESVWDARRLCGLTVFGRVCVS